MHEVADPFLQTGGAPLGHGVVRPGQANLVERQRVVQRIHPARQQVRYRRRLANVVAGQPVLADESARLVAAQIDGVLARTGGAAAGGHAVVVGGGEEAFLVIIAGGGSGGAGPAS